jgi:hemerythrin-like domain-containing protein
VTARHKRVMDRLIVEHRSVFALLRELERVASQTSPLTAGDYCLARDIVAYVHDYSDNIHHPTEDLVFARLLARRPAMKPTVQRLRDDHEAMAVETRSLFNLLDALATRRASGRHAAVRKACTDYVAHQRAHMQFENRELFPAAARWLTAADWRAVAANFLVADDPLFGTVVSRKHRVLYEYLLDPGAMTRPSDGARSWRSLQAHQRTAGIVYQSGREWLARVFQFWGTVGTKALATYAQALPPRSLSDALALPVTYAKDVGSAAAACSADLYQIGRTAAQRTLANYTQDGPKI